MDLLITQVTTDGQLSEVEDEANEWGLPGSERRCGTQLSEKEKRGASQG